MDTFLQVLHSVLMVHYISSFLSSTYISAIKLPLLRAAANCNSLILLWQLTKMSLLFYLFFWHPLPSGYLLCVYWGTCFASLDTLLLLSYQTRLLSLFNWSGHQILLVCFSSPLLHLPIASSGLFFILNCFFLIQSYPGVKLPTYWCSSAIFLLGNGIAVYYSVHYYFSARMACITDCWCFKLCNYMLERSK